MRSMISICSLPPSASNMNVCARSFEKSRSHAEPAVPSPGAPLGPSVAPVPGTTGMTRCSDAGLGEDLDAVVLAVADVHQSVVAADDAMRMAAVPRAEQRRGSRSPDC